MGQVDYAALAAQARGAAAPPVDRSQWDKRADGSTKGDGFFGVLPRPDGKVSSEISIGVNLDGKEVEIPTLVPTLSPQERNWLITSDVSEPNKIPPAIVQKAVDFARLRQRQGKPFFAQAGEQVPPMDYATLAAQARGGSAPVDPAAGTWEDRGIGGKVWHPASGATERGRVDNSLLGVPPELAVTGALGIGRAIAAPGLTYAGRAVAGAKAAVGQAAPLVKYEATKAALLHIGLPEPLAVAAAMAVSGYQKGAKAPAAASTTAADEAAIAARPPPNSAPNLPPQLSAPPPPPPPGPIAAAQAARLAQPLPVAPVPPPVATPAAVDEFTAARAARANALPDQRALNDQALAARRAAYQASQGGAPPGPASAPEPPPTPAPPTGPVVKASGQMKLTAPEWTEFQRLLKRKIPAADALTAVQQMRELAARLGGATPAEVAKAVAQRDATGKW